MNSDSDHTPDGDAHTSKGASPPKKWVLLLSGGLDSATLAADLKAQGHSLVALSVLYGQRHSREMVAAQELSEHLQIAHRTVDLTGLQPLISKSSQTGDFEVPEGHYTEASMKLTVVPNRNMILLSVALGLAVNLRYDGVAYAAHSGDHTIYPDCRRVFVDAMNDAAQLCDWHPVKVWAPYATYSKADILKRALELSLPIEKTWSCYKGEDIHCGRCGTCVERREAFALLNLPDPTRYQSDGQALDDLAPNVSYPTSASMRIPMSPSPNAPRVGNL